LSPRIGEVVVWHDEHGLPHDALITNVHGEGDTPSINVVVVNDDKAQTDTYGRKIQRETSVVHKVNQYANGRWWIAKS
jgi:hypothetical protein